MQRRREHLQFPPGLSRKIRPKAYPWLPCVHSAVSGPTTRCRVRGYSKFVQAATRNHAPLVRFLAIDAVERIGPGLAVIVRCFPMLPHAAVGFRRPGNALQLRLASLRVALPADHRHIAVLDSAFEAQHAVGIVADPELMPALRLRFPGVGADAVA